MVGTCTVSAVSQSVFTVLHEAQGKTAYAISTMTGCLVPAHMDTHAIRLVGRLQHVLLFFMIEYKLNN